MSASPSLPASLSLCLLAATVCVFAGAQIMVASIEGSQLDRQLNASAQKLASVKNTTVKLEEALRARAAQIAQVSEMESGYAALLTELIELARADVDARAITQKWKIQRHGESPGGPSPSPAGTQEAKTLGAPQRAKAPGELPGK